MTSYCENLDVYTTCFKIVYAISTIHLVRMPLRILHYALQAFTWFQAAVEREDEGAWQVQTLTCLFLAWPL